MRRVVITGMGAVTPIGNTAPEYWQGLIAGRCGIDKITRFDTADYAVKIAAEVKGFDYQCCMSKEPVSYTHLDVYKRQAGGLTKRHRNLILS